MKEIVVEDFATDRRTPDWTLILTKMMERSWRIVAAGAVVGAVLALLYSVVTPAAYEASSLVSQADGGSSVLSGASSLAKGFGLSGVFSTQTSSPYAEFIATLNSQENAAALEKQGWNKIIFSSLWDQRCRCWRRPPVTSALKDAWDAIFGGSGWHPPDSVTLYRFLQTHVKIAPSSHDGMDNIEVYMSDPNLAKKLLTAVIASGDQLVRERAKARALSSKDYLLSEGEGSNQVLLRESILTLLVEQERLLASLSSPEMYSARMVLPPYTTSDVVWPRPGILLIFGAMVGGLAVAAWQIIGDFRRSGVNT